jgi:hypothetical protein
MEYPFAPEDEDSEAAAFVIHAEEECQRAEEVLRKVAEGSTVAAGRMRSLFSMRVPRRSEPAP